MALIIKRNDTYPPVEATLLDNNGNVIDLTNASVVMKLKKIGLSTVVSKDMEIVSAIGGTVKYDWEAADTATAGVYDLEFEITFADNSILTVPNDSYEQLRIIEDLS